jgi:hypothetical protein
MTTASITPASGVVFVAVHYKNTAITTPDVSTISGLGGTWQQCGASILSANSLNRLALWYGYGCSGTGALTITATTTPTSANGYEVVEFTGVTPGVGAIVSGNYKSVSGAATANNVTVTPNALANPNNAFMVAAQHLTAEDDVPSQGTEIHDDNLASVSGLEVNYLVGWTSGGMGATWATTTGSQGRVVGVEVAAVAATLTTLITPVSRLPFIPKGRSF